MACPLKPLRGIGSVLNRTGKTRVVLHRAISDMIASMELQRPRATPVLPQWDLGVVLEALNKPPYEPLREASFKHLTLKTVFLLSKYQGTATYFRYKMVTYERDRIQNICCQKSIFQLNPLSKQLFSCS